MSLIGKQSRTRAMAIYNVKDARLLGVLRMSFVLKQGAPLVGRLEAQATGFGSTNKVTPLAQDFSMALSLSEPNTRLAPVFHWQNAPDGTPCKESLLPTTSGHFVPIFLSDIALDFDADIDAIFDLIILDFERFFGTHSSALNNVLAIMECQPWEKPGPLLASQVRTYLHVQKEQEALWVQSQTAKAS